MPVKWEENWSLPDGAPRSAIERRNNSIHRLGNLTLATQSLNSTLSNQAWSKKRHTLQTHSLARLTTGSILTFPHGGDNFTQDEWVSAWDEDRIGLRELALIRCALAAWPRPSEPDADFVDLEVFQTTETSRAAEARTRTDQLVHGDLLPLIVRGLVKPGDRLRHQKVRAGTKFHATVTGSGGLDTSAGHFRAPSPALSKLVGSSRNGWTDWTHVPTGKTLGELREMLRDSLRDGALNDGEADG